MPVNINLLSDEAIARGVTPADVGQGISAFQTGQDYAQKQALQNLFSEGLPRDPNNPKLFDYPKITEMLARVSGAPAIPLLATLRQADIQQQALNQNANLPDIFPPLPTQPRVQMPPSTGRPPAQSQSYLNEPDQGGGEPARPRQANLTSPTEVPGSARVSYDGGPMMALASEPQQPSPGYPREFSNVPVGPTTDRFTPPPPAEAPVQVAQARTSTQQPPVGAPARPPITDTNDPGYWTLENARAYDRAAYIFNRRAENLGIGGLKGEGGPAQQAKQLGDRANQIYEHLSKLGEEREKARLKVEGAVPEKLAEHSVAQLSDTYKKAQTFAEGVPATQNLLDQINSKSGIFSGKWAEQRLSLAKIGEVFGVPDDRVMPTEAYKSLVGRKVAATVKSFGSGTSITNQDREYASNMEGGNINLDETSMRRILTLSDQVARDNIKNHNRDVDKLQKVYPGAPLGNFKVEEPPKLAGRTTQPKPAPPGVIPPAPSMDQRQPDQVYQTPKGPARWRGTGWELVR